MAVSTGFEDRATAFLAGWTVRHAMNEAIRGEGHWHPTGFVVFTTLNKFEDMPVRVHCWPRGPRLGDVGHPPLHTHVWPLASKVVLGVYMEARLALERASDGLVRSYDVTYGDNYQSTISPRDGRFRVDDYQVATYKTGEIHSLPEGAWHQTLVSDGQRVVTVMVTGLQVLQKPSIAGEIALPEFTRGRVPVDKDFLRSEFGDLLPDDPD